MSEAIIWSHDHARPEQVLYLTETGNRLHIPACPHIGGTLREADAVERLSMTVCSWCQAEIDGVGRTDFETLDDAMRAFGCHVGTHGLIRDALRFVTYDQIWLPYSKSYIALGHQCRGAAWAGKTYVMPSADTFVELPGYEETHGGVGHRHLRALRVGLSQGSRHRNAPSWGGNEGNTIPS